MSLQRDTLAGRTHNSTRAFTQQCNLGKSNAQRGKLAKSPCYKGTTEGNNVSQVNVHGTTQLTRKMKFKLGGGPLLGN